MNEPVGETFNPKVMLIEDDESMLSILKTLLDYEGFQIVAVEKNQQIESVTDIIEMLRKESPDLLLLDIFFRQINGLDVLRALRDDAQVSGTRVLISSGMDLSSDCHQAGADGFLLKPYMPDDLIQTIRDLIRV
ncbi:MAG: response regulator [Anaerolineales bacterium]|nr:response regulator [Anaerolineales bacterium]